VKLQLNVSVAPLDETLTAVGATLEVLVAIDFFVVTKAEVVPHLEVVKPGVVWLSEGVGKGAGTTTVI
jgi:hypothetical protein